MKRKDRIISGALCIGAAAMTAFASREMVQGVREGLTLCGTVVIPSLFPFFVLCTFMVHTGFAADLGRLLRRPMQSLFRLPPAAAAAVLLGFCGGYPVGVRMTAQLYARGELTAQQAERMCLFCVAAGPAFVLGTVGGGMLHSAAAGRLLLASVTLSSLTLGVFLRFTDSAADDGIRLPAAREGAAASLCAAVADGGKGMLSMCRWVILFSGVCRACTKLPPGAGTALGCLLEVTNGCALAQKIGLPLPLTAGILGFGGLSVHCQLLPDVTSCGVRLTRFWAFRALNGGLSAVYAAALLHAFPYAAPTLLSGAQPMQLAGTNVYVSVSLLCTAAVFILNTAPEARTAES